MTELGRSTRIAVVDERGPNGQRKEALYYIVGLETIKVHTRRARRADGPQIARLVVIGGRRLVIYRDPSTVVSICDFIDYLASRRVA